MSVTRLQFLLHFPFPYMNQNRPLFGVKVFRAGSDSKKSDESLVKELNQHKLGSEYAINFTTRQDEGQDCFGGGFRALPEGWNKEQLGRNISKLNGMTVSEVAALWKNSGQDIYKLLTHLDTMQINMRPQVNLNSV